MAFLVKWPNHGTIVWQKWLFTVFTELKPTSAYDIGKTVRNLGSTNQRDGFDRLTNFQNNRQRTSRTTICSDQTESARSGVGGADLTPEGHPPVFVSRSPHRPPAFCASAAARSVLSRELVQAPGAPQHT